MKPRMLAKIVSMIRKYHKLQTNPWLREEENEQQPMPLGGLNAFYWYKIFTLDSAVVEAHKMLSSHGGFLTIVSSWRNNQVWVSWSAPLLFAYDKVRFACIKVNTSELYPLFPLKMCGVGSYLKEHLYEQILSKVHIWFAVIKNFKFWLIIYTN